MAAVKSPKLNAQQKIVHELSERLVKAQRPIRILDAIKWDPKIRKQFFKTKCKELPQVAAHYYDSSPLAFDPEQKTLEFYTIERDVRRQLGQFSGVGNILLRMCREYREVIRLLHARGTPEFSSISQELYGSSEDAFYAGAPTLNDLAHLLSDTLPELTKVTLSEADKKVYSSDQAVVILNERLNHYFGDHKGTVRVKLSDEIIADAAAGAEFIRLRKDAVFSQRDLRALEVHEGWVHLGTTMNGLSQPICTFLGKGPPSSTVTQEGLAIIMEIFTFSSHPRRVQRITDRISAINMAEQGANFIDVFEFFRGNNDLDEFSCYSAAARVFRGSTPTLGPFTKDLAYSKGFILIYNYIRLAVQKGLLSRIPLLFVGKTTIEDLHVIEDLIKEGLVVAPTFLPEQFQDLAGLSSWMCYSLFLNKLRLDKLGANYKGFLND